MKSKSHVLVVAALASAFLLSARADPDPTPTPLGAEKAIAPLNHVQVENMQGEHLGSIKDVGIDLPSGRIVEVLVASGGFLGIGARIVAVPPLALHTDGLNKVFRLDVSAAAFKAAPSIDLSTWNDAGQGERVAASYRYFAQEPYFRVEGVADGKTAGRPKAPLGYVGRANKTMGLPVSNLLGEPLGKVGGVTLDIAQGRIRSVIVLASGNGGERSVIPATAFDYTSSRKGLLLDRSKAEYENEPRLVYTAPANGQAGSSVEESYTGPHTSVALEQGSDARDTDRTSAIRKDLRLAKIDTRNIEVGTLDGRVTLRGWVKTEAERVQIGGIAIAASRLELVDNQITVGKPVPAK